MSELRKADYDAVFFISMTVVSWVDVFTRREYCEEIIKSIRFCQQHKGLELYAYVIMTNHIHWVAAQKDGRLNDLLRDFKSFTAKQILNCIFSNRAESRSDWMDIVFKYNAKFKRQNAEYMFWQRTNHPVDCYNRDVLLQKINYVHKNPVRAGFVEEAENWRYSSANPHSPIKVLEF